MMAPRMVKPARAMLPLRATAAPVGGGADEAGGAAADEAAGSEGAEDAGAGL